jgi:tRNA 2-thiouridine synthesizing protein C
MKKYLIIMQHSPYESSLALEGLELALAIAAFNQEVSLLFMGPGVLQLTSNQNPDPLVHKEFTKAYTGLSLFGINDVYACQDSLAAYGNPDLMLQPQVADEIKITELLKEHDIVLNV